MKYCCKTIGVIVLLALCACQSNEKSQNKNFKSPSSSNSSNSSSSSSSSSGPIESTLKTISGRLTFDLVPFLPGSDLGLDYSNTRPEPIERVLVEALDANDQILASTVSAEDGMYALQVPANTLVRIKVNAQMSNSNPSWAVELVDNTNDYQMYYLQGQLANSGPQGGDQQRNLHAPSGWSGGRYEGARSAAPFAILDALLEAYEMMEAIDPQLDLPLLQVSWSTENVPESPQDGEEDAQAMAQGIIASSHYNSGDKRVYILGKENVDTDEYDRSVILHEFTHYLEAAIFRDDGLGGDHGDGSYLDMRTAFGEGLGNAMAGIFGQSQYYKDSYGAGQADMGLYMDLENGFEHESGFYSEATVQSFLYDLVDEQVDGADDIQLPFIALYNALVSQAYKDFSGTVSIYLISDVLKNMQPNVAQQINTLGEQYGLVLNDAYGTGETNGTSSDVVLPIYRSLSVGESIEVCTDKTNQESNGVGVARFILVELFNQGRYRFSAQHTRGDHTDADPDFQIFYQGTELAKVHQSNGTAEVYESESMAAGTYLIVLSDWRNSDDDDSTGGLSCFTFSVEEI